jgi:hypothetical protein
VSHSPGAEMHSFLTPTLEYQNSASLSFGLTPELTLTCKTTCRQHVVGLLNIQNQMSNFPSKFFLISLYLYISSYLSSYPSIYLPIYHLSIYITYPSISFIHVSTYVYMYICMYVCVCVFIYLSIYLSIYHLSMYVSICLSINLYIIGSVSLDNPG